MKKRISRTLALSILSVVAGSVILFGAGCSKKSVMPPDEMKSEMSGGKDINYPKAENGYSENNLPVEGSLDDQQAPGAAGATTSMMSDADRQSDEYKRMHGRCSANLSPIYFDFDQAGVRPNMVDVLAANAEYLKSVPGTLVTIEGNSDERGTNEYNLALGERRAINTRQYLINLGISPDRMRTLSYGEERPLFPGQDEEAYSMNRRVDFIAQ